MRHTDPNHETRVRHVFDDWAHRGRGEGMADAHWPFAAQALEHLGLRTDSWFLDIGCGIGYAVCWAARAAARGRAVGIDTSEGMIALARERCVGLPNADFHVARFPGHHTLPAGRFDAAFSMEVFYYLADIEAALAETLRLLAPGGRFACVVDFYRENTDSHHWPADLGVAMHLLSAAEWAAAFRRAGFTEVTQARLRVAAEQATEPWKATEGSLLTLGHRA